VRLRCVGIAPDEFAAKGCAFVSDGLAYGGDDAVGAGEGCFGVGGAAGAGADDEDVGGGGEDVFCGGLCEGCVFGMICWRRWHVCGSRVGDGWVSLRLSGSFWVLGLWLDFAGRG